MKNCNCKDKEVTPCNDKCVIRQMIDECSGNKINYITLASAVLMGCNDTETVEDVLNEIQRKLNQIDSHIDEFTWDAIIAFLKNNLTRLEPELTNLINSRIENYFLHNDFAGLKQLFRQLFAEWETTFTNLIERIGQGISREELDSILNTRLAPYYTKAEIDALLSNLGGVKGVAINGASHAPNDTGLVNLGTGFLKSENLDSTPTSGSSNPVTSNGIYNALINKQDKADAIKDVIFEVNGSSLINNQDHKAYIPPYGLATALFKGKNTEADNNVNFYVKAYDVNDDGIWDIADVNAVINVMLGNEAPSVYDGRTDINGDGVTQIDDVNQVINMMLGKTEEGPYVAYRNSDYTDPIALSLNHIYLNKNINDLFQVVRTNGNRFFIKYLHINSDNDFKAAAENSLIVNVNSVNSYTCTHTNIGSYDQFIKLVNEEASINFVYNGQVSQSANLNIDDEGTISCEVTITTKDEEGHTEDVKYHYIWEKGKKSIMTTAPIIVNGKYISLNPKITEELTTNIFSIKNNLDNFNIIRNISIRQDGELITPDNNGDIIVDAGIPIELTVGYNENCLIINDETSERCIPH